MGSDSFVSFESQQGLVQEQRLVEVVLEGLLLLGRRVLQKVVVVHAKS